MRTLIVFKGHIGILRGHSFGLLLLAFFWCISPCQSSPALGSFRGKTEGGRRDEEVHRGRINFWASEDKNLCVQRVARPVDFDVP